MHVPHPTIDHILPPFGVQENLWMVSVLTYQKLCQTRTKEIAKNNASAQNINTVLKLKSMHEMKGKRIPPSFTYFKNSH